MLVALQLKMIHVDAALGPVNVMFSTAREPIAAAGGTTVSGRLAVARQVTAPPAQYRRKIAVGRVRDVEVAVCMHVIHEPLLCFELTAEFHVKLLKLPSNSPFAESSLH